MFRRHPHGVKAVPDQNALGDAYQVVRGDWFQRYHSSAPWDEIIRLFKTKRLTIRVNPHSHDTENPPGFNRVLEPLDATDEERRVPGLRLTL